VHLLTNLLNLYLKDKISEKKVIFVFTTVQVLSFLLYFTGTFNEFNISNTLSSGILILLAITLIYLQKSKTSFKLVEKTHFLILFVAISWFIAECLFGYYNGFLEEDPYPSLADLFYLVGYTLIVAYLIIINKIYKIEFSIIVSALFTFSIIVFYVIYLSIFIFQVPLYSGNIFDLVLLFFYPLVDIFILIGSIMYYFKGRSISISNENRFWILIALFGFFFFMADLTYGYDDLIGSHNNYIFDLFFNFGYLFLGIGVIIRMGYHIDIKKQ
jgi:hypothetical protein